MRKDTGLHRLFWVIATFVIGFHWGARAEAVESRFADLLPNVTARDEQKVQHLLVTLVRESSPFLDSEFQGALEAVVARSHLSPRDGFDVAVRMLGGQPPTIRAIILKDGIPVLNREVVGTLDTPRTSISIRLPSITGEVDGRREPTEVAREAGDSAIRQFANSASDISDTAIFGEAWIIQKSGMLIRSSYTEVKDVDLRHTKSIAVSYELNGVVHRRVSGTADHVAATGSYTTFGANKTSSPVFGSTNVLPTEDDDCLDGDDKWIDTVDFLLGSPSMCFFDDTLEATSTSGGINRWTFGSPLAPLDSSPAEAITAYNQLRLAGERYEAFGYAASGFNEIDLVAGVTSTVFNGRHTNNGVYDCTIEVARDQADSQTGLMVPTHEFFHHFAHNFGPALAWDNEADGTMPKAVEEGLAEFFSEAATPFGSGNYVKYPNPVLTTCSTANCSNAGSTRCACEFISPSLTSTTDSFAYPSQSCQVAGFTDGCREFQNTDVIISTMLDLRERLEMWPNAVAHTRTFGQTAHPYANNTNSEIVSISHPGVTSVAVLISNINMEAGYDKIEIRDGNNILKCTYSGGNIGSWLSCWVVGDTLKVRLVTDYSVTGQGFTVSQFYHNGTTGSVTERIAAKAVTLTDGDDGFNQWRENMLAADAAIYGLDHHAALLGTVFDDHGINSTLDTFCEANCDACYGDLVCP